MVNVLIAGCYQGCRALRYFIYTAKDLEEWSENPESFHHEQNLVQWTEKQRPCAEALFIVIFENYREDAAYTAAGHVYYELSNYLSFNEWQGIAGGKQHKFDPERRTRELRAVPTPDANAELVSSLQRYCHSLLSKSLAPSPI